MNATKIVTVKMATKSKLQILKCSLDDDESGGDDVTVKSYRFVRTSGAGFLVVLLMLMQFVIPSHSLRVLVNPNDPQRYLNGII